MHAGIGNIMARIVQLNSDIRPPSEMELMLARFLFERRMSSYITLHLTLLPVLILMSSPGTGPTTL